MPSLERRLAEQAAVEERDRAERARRARTPPHRRVERSEPEGKEHPLMETTTARHAVVEPAREEGAVAVEPTLRLEKRQEEQA